VFRRFRCIACNESFPAKRSDAWTCSARCRKRLQRYIEKREKEGFTPREDATAVQLTDAANVDPTPSGEVVSGV